MTMEVGLGFKKLIGVVLRCQHVRRIIPVHSKGGVTHKPSKHTRTENFGAFCIMLMHNEEYKHYMYTISVTRL